MFIFHQEEKTHFAHSIYTKKIPPMRTIGGKRALGTKRMGGTKLKRQLLNALINLFNHFIHRLESASREIPDIWI